MQTAKQAERINAFTSQVNDTGKMICEPIIESLLALGYTPKKHKKINLAIAFEKKGRIISKMEIAGDSKELKLHLRFSACERYSKIFEDAVAERPEAWRKRNQEYVNFDVKECCGNCKGKPRLYRFTNQTGDVVTRCGGYTVYIPGITLNNVPEILSLIKEQDQYFTYVLQE